MIGGVIVARLYGEMIMLFFKMNEALQEIRHKP